MVFRTRVIVRLGTQNRMVTKGYRKGVYDRVTLANVGASMLAASRCKNSFGSAVLWRVGKQGMINNMRRGIDPLIQFDLRHARGLRQQTPEEAVHHPGQPGNIYSRPCAEQFLQ